MSTSLITIQQGVPVEAVTLESELFFLGTASAGDPRAPRRLVWPAALTPLLAPLVYALGATPLNPTRTLNLDTQVLPHPRTQVVETLGATRSVRFERALADVVVTEIWGAEAGASMTSAFFRLLYEYLRNSALIPAGGPFIAWEPRDRSTRSYAVALLSLSAGSSGEDDEARFDVADLRADPGTGAKELDDALRSLSATETGLVTTEVRLRFQILGEL